MINYPEFQIALTAAREQHDHVCEDMARQVIEMLNRVRSENRKNGVSEKFGESIRKALNRRDVQANRDAYKCVIGHYFGKRGRAAIASGQSKQPLPERTMPEVEIEPNGQVTLVL